MTAAGEVLASFVCDCCRTTISLGRGVLRPVDNLCTVCSRPVEEVVGKLPSGTRSLLFDTGSMRCVHMAALIEARLRATQPLAPPPQRRFRKLRDLFRGA